MKNEDRLKRLKEIRKKLVGKETKLYDDDVKFMKQFYRGSVNLISLEQLMLLANDSKN